MYKTRIKRLLPISLMFCIYSFGISQPPREPFISSPRVHSDKKVTFSHLASSAKQVLLSGSQFGAAQVPIIKDSIGIWSVTVGPVRPTAVRIVLLLIG